MLGLLLGKMELAGLAPCSTCTPFWAGQLAVSGVAESFSTFELYCKVKDELIYQDELFL